MAAKLVRLTHGIAIQLHLVAESSTICSSRSRRPVRNLLDTRSYIFICESYGNTILIKERSLLSNGYWGLFLRGQSGRSVKLTTHLHLVSGYNSTPLYFIMAWCLLSRGYVFMTLCLVKHRNKFKLTLLL
jgi:hypothetical protein